jgi:hypothetical protein
MHRNRIAPPLLAALTLAVLALGATACGYESHETHVAEGHPVELGDLEYSVTFSRFLNPNDTEDVAFLVGQPPPPENTDYFGVFIEVQNTSKGPQTLANSMKITDSDHNEYEAVESESLFAFPFGSEVEAEEQVPVLDSAAQLGPIEGSVAIFAIPVEASEARPLTLHIPGQGDEAAEVELDL